MHLRSWRASDARWRAVRQLKQCISKFKPEVMLCIAFLYVCTSLEEETSIEKMHFKKLKRECNLVGEASLQSCEIIVGGIV